MVSSVINHLNNVVDGHPWFGPSIFNVLDRMSIEILNKSPYSEGRSIADYLAHMMAWREFVIEKLRGNAQYSVEINSDQDWPKHPINSIEDFQKVKDFFSQSNKMIISILSNWTDEMLDEIVPGQEYTFDHALNGLIQHDVYHLGQLMLTYRMVSQ